MGGGMLWEIDERERAAAEGGDAGSVREKGTHCAGFEGSADDGQFGIGRGGYAACFCADAGMPVGSGECEQADSGVVQHDKRVVAVWDDGAAWRKDDLKASDERGFRWRGRTV